MAISNVVAIGTAFDATPDPTGAEIYITAVGANGPGVFKAKADGSDAMATEVAAGAPFVAPFGIATSTDGKLLYIADPGADIKNDHGALISLPVGGGNAAAIAGTEDYLPRGVEVAVQGGKDVIFFTGTDPADGKHGVFSIPATGNVVTAVAKGAPFDDPSGIAIAANGDIYVTDTSGSGDSSASVVQIKGGVATTFLTKLRVGYPAGIALNANDSTLYVSGLDPATLTDFVQSYDVASKTEADLFPQPTLTESAGLHRAKAANVFSLVDDSAVGGGVFLLK